MIGFKKLMPLFRPIRIKNKTHHDSHLFLTCSCTLHHLHVINSSFDWFPVSSVSLGMQSSRLTFQLASPVASERFDLHVLAKTNFSPARHRHLLRNVNKKLSQTDKYKVFSPLILTEVPSKLRNCCCCLAKYRFTIKCCVPSLP